MIQEPHNNNRKGEGLYLEGNFTLLQPFFLGPISKESHQQQLSGVDAKPLTTPPSSTGRDRTLGCRAAGSLASRRCSTCCGPSGWCRRGGTARSERSGSESPGCRRIWDSAPTHPSSTWMQQSEEITETKAIRFKCIYYLIYLLQISVYKMRNVTRILILLQHFLGFGNELECSAAQKHLVVS